MPRGMPALAAGFDNQVQRAAGIAELAERARTLAPTQSPLRRELIPTRLGAMYEMAYLRVFVAWESFLEETFVRMLCGYVSPVWVPVFSAPGPPFSNLRDARAALYAGRDYVLWHNPVAVTRRAGQWFHQGPHEAVVNSQLADLESLAAIRHRITHPSEDARVKFDNASVDVAGRTYPGSSPGRLLRDWKPNTNPAIRWLVALAQDLVGLAYQISP